MSEKDNGSFKLSRRKALAGMGSIGLAGALGIGGTYAQFSDTEEQAVTFTAGGIDGEIKTSASYNGERIDPDTELVSMNTDGVVGEVGVKFAFEDIKPGDFGCFNFSITLANNPAWVASCVDVTRDLDWMNYEPEIEADENVTRENLHRNDGGSNATLEPGVLDADGNPTGEAAAQGDLAANMLTLPYYDGDGYCQFFDAAEDDFIVPEGSDYSIPSEFWSNSQEGSGEFDVQAADEGGTTFLAPLSFAEVDSMPLKAGTTHFNAEEGTFQSYSTPEGVELGDGCIMLDGSTAGVDPSTETLSYSPMVPGATLNFGYDWHLPFATGNEAQGDRMEVVYGFKFIQTRHTDAPQFGTYAPGNNTAQTPE